MLPSAITTAVRKFIWNPQPHGALGEVVRVPMIALWKFQRDRGPLRASALAFSSALGLVPLLALAFTVLRALGVQSKLETVLIQHLSASNMQVAETISNYVAKINFGTLGVAGLMSLLLSALVVLNNIEYSFNDIWGAARGRSILRKFTDYTAILIAVPILLLISTSLTTTAVVGKFLPDVDLIKKAMPLLFSFGPLAAKAIAFAAAFLIVPNHRVGVRAALVGGVVTGVLWHLAEWGYINFGIGISRHNAVYGALAQLPAFLIWIYMSWCLVLAGAELACVLELPGRGRYLKGGRELWGPRPAIALGLLTGVVLGFKTGNLVDEDDLVAAAGIHPVEGRRVINELVRAKLLMRTEGDDDEEGRSFLLPACEPSELKMSELLAMMVTTAEKGEQIDRVEELLLSDFGKAFDGITWAEWAENTQGAKS